MHLIELPIKLNASLHKMIPRTISYLYGKSGIKYFRTYTLGNLHVYYVDAFNRIDIIIMADSRQVKSEEIDFAIENLMPGVDKASLEINEEAKAAVEAVAKKKLQYADIVIIEQKVKA
ncbi:DUF1827 family protein [Agrilactobacillus yilanensis]|uniref:DUF1827 family protein n=1 Tax=Agrilactobacillus yilanensis TaxID=2485997 RepID=A0ABW4J5X9_9LACO|nr:DUF1827 family protein [Agrilactobacillus yilanensis]